ncbi:hypothetical protein GTY41_24915, partial [Streptomyces sp. SID685]|nr:hypothetical protein [Streptomyces sp. SID685]
MAPDAVVPVRAAFFPVLPLVPVPVPVSFPPLVLPLVEVPVPPLVSLEEAPVVPWPPAELLAEAGVLLCAAVLEPPLPPHAVNERPAAATITARAEIF